MNNHLPVPAVVSAVRHMSADTSLFSLRCTGLDEGTGMPPSVTKFLPGQFLELSVPGIGEVPISYCGRPTEEGIIELCIRHIGHVTVPLLGFCPGDRVGLRGPFGRGFPLEAYADQDLVLAAGGLGMAPLRSLLLALLAQRERWGKLTLLYGAREPGALLFLDELQEFGNRDDISISLAVDRPDDGRGYPPNCRLALLPALLDSIAINPDRTYAALCGPPAAYPCLVQRLKEVGFSDDRIHLSLERRMKCGLGHCGHCAVGTFLCCTDGPVFSYGQLQGIEGALI